MKESWHEKTETVKMSENEPEARWKSVGSKEINNQICNTMRDEKEAALTKAHSLPISTSAASPSA
jgi:hypothetical protein